MMPLPIPVLLAAHFILGMTATCGFALGFNVPREVLARTCFFGGGAYALRYVLMSYGQAPAAVAFWSALFVGFAGYLQARKVRVPRVLITVPAIVPLVPGIASYDAIVCLFRGEVMEGLASGVRATIVTAALAGGLTVARAVTMSGRSDD